jgi:hypothetical protein
MKIESVLTKEVRQQQSEWAGKKHCNIPDEIVGRKNS